MEEKAKPKHPERAVRVDRHTIIYTRNPDDADAIRQFKERLNNRARYTRVHRYDSKFLGRRDNRDDLIKNITS